MAQDDGDSDFETPSGTPLHTPRQATSDYSDQVDKQIDLYEQDKINMEHRKQRAAFFLAANRHHVHQHIQQHRSAQLRAQK